MDDELRANAREILRGFAFAGETSTDRALYLIDPFTSSSAPYPDELEDYDMDAVQVDLTDTPDVPL